jgi:uncharacterized protein (TIGR02453 family)
MHVKALVNYLEGLKENNHRAWFAMNKPSYDIARAEFIEATAQVIGQLTKHDPMLAGVEAKKSLFRINRDIRFSKDKSPYKTNFSAAIAPRGKKDRGPHYYFEVAHDGMMMTACGIYHPDKDATKSIRDTIAADVKGFEKLLKAKPFASTFGGLWGGGEEGDMAEDKKLVRPPKGYTPETPGIEHIKNRNFIVFRKVRATSMKPDEVIKHAVADFKVAIPFVKWLREASGVYSTRSQRRALRRATETSPREMP